MEWQGIRVITVIKVKNRYSISLSCLLSRQSTIEIENTSSSLLLKELGPDYYTRERKKPKIDPVDLHEGNLTLDQVIKVAKILDVDGKNLSKTMAGFVKCIIGTA